MSVDSMNVSIWKHEWRGVVWDTPMASWAGEELDWVQKLIRHPSTKEDVIIAVRRNIF